MSHKQTENPPKKQLAGNTPKSKHADTLGLERRLLDVAVEGLLAELGVVRAGPSNLGGGRRGVGVPEDVNRAHHRIAAPISIR